MNTKYRFTFIFFLTSVFFNLQTKTITQENKSISAFEQFILDLEFAESCYSGDDNKSISLETKIDTLKTLQEYITQYQDSIYHYKNKANPEKLRELNSYFLLSREIARHLQKHLKEEYSWQETDHFTNITKPLIYSAGLYLGLIASAKILEKLKIISHPRNIQAYSSLMSIGLASSWITYNYKDSLFKKAK